MKRKVCRVNRQGKADRPEYRKILPGQQPIRFQNWWSDAVFLMVINDTLISKILEKHMTNSLEDLKENVKFWRNDSIQLFIRVCC